MNVSIAEQDLQLLPQRALLWPAARTLFVADLHVGKTETFQRHGIALPDAQAAADIERLDGLLTATRAQRVCVLGDLIHGAYAKHTAGFAALTARHPDVEFQLVAGNHDQHAPDLPAAWRVAVHQPGMVLGPFVLQHEPTPSAAGYVLAGHTHPVVRVQGVADSLRFPCFHFSAQVGTLPAFTEFAGGACVDTRLGRTYAIVENEVVAL